MIGVPVAMRLEYSCGPAVHRVVVLLGDGSRAEEFDACYAGVGGGAFRDPLSHGGTADIAQADEDDADGSTR
jgi:hypothetical protein